MAWSELPFSEVTGIGLNRETGVNAAGKVFDEVALRVLSPPSSAGRRSPDAPFRIWTLDPLDQGAGLGIIGQFRPENIQISYENEIGEVVPQNSDEAVQNYVKGKVDTITFEATVFGDSERVEQVSFDDLGPDRKAGVTVDDALGYDPRWPAKALARLKGAVKKDPKLQRPPIYLFTAGSDIVFLCLVNRVEVNVMDLRADGSLRGFKAQITLRHYDPIDRVDLRSWENLKFIGTAATVTGELDWEMIGWIEYGLSGVGSILEDYNVNWARDSNGAPLHPGASIMLPPGSEVELSDPRNPGSVALGAAESAASFAAELLGK